MITGVESIEKEFLSWVAPRPAGHDHYALYREILDGLPEPAAFWSFVWESCSQLKPSTRKNHFFGAVQYVVLANPDEPLAAYFPTSLSYDPTRNVADAGSIFWNLLSRRRSEIVGVIGKREVQINKLGRLALFAPLFLEIRQRCRQSLAFVDVGCSVGLGLLWPYFRYSYPGYGQISADEVNGDLVCQIEGKPNLPLQGILPPASFLCGIEHEPLSATDPNDVRWLFALTAPGDSEGRARLELGLALVAKKRPPIAHGCILDVLPRVVAELPGNVGIVIYHAMTLHHLSADKTVQFENLLQRLSHRHRLFDAGVEWTNEPKYPTPVSVTLTEWTSDGPKREQLAETDPSADGVLLRFR